MIQPTERLTVDDTGLMDSKVNKHQERPCAPTPDNKRGGGWGGAEGIGGGV